MILAGIDIGTLTCRLLIADISADGRLTELRAERRLLRLGDGVDEHRILRPAAMARVIETLKDWRHIIAAYSVDREIAVATSAVRDAGNRAEFLSLIRRDAGFSVEVISGEEEARRTMIGVRSGLPPRTSDVLALDIGGGSTEFIVDRPGYPPVVRSFDIGVVRLAERFLKHDPPTSKEVEEMRTVVRAGTAEVQPLLRHLPGITCVGTAGTITTLAAMAQRLDGFEHAQVHNYPLTMTDIVQLERELLSRTEEERRGMPGLEPGREEVIVAGAIILRAVMNTLGKDECRVSNFGLREGLLFSVAAGS
jgi:exopolyphosphatase / guanosine-5'-triphosphate,3'-diphosphate pyrophosphatase